MLQLFCYDDQPCSDSKLLCENNIFGNWPIFYCRFSPVAKGVNLAKIPPNQVIADFGRESGLESESEWCPAGTLGRFQLFKMTSRMATTVIFFCNTSLCKFLGSTNPFKWVKEKLPYLVTGLYLLKYFVLYLNRFGIELLSNTYQQYRVFAYIRSDLIGKKKSEYVKRYIKV